MKELIFQVRYDNNRPDKYQQKELCCKFKAYFGFCPPNLFSGATVKHLLPVDTSVCGKTISIWMHIHGWEASVGVDIYRLFNYFPGELNGFKGKLIKRGEWYDFILSEPRRFKHHNDPTGCWYGK